MLGSRKLTPMTRPHCRWIHSIQKIRWKSAKSICGFSTSYSGEDRYLANSVSQSVALSGGIDPVMGRHSVMLSLRTNKPVSWLQSHH